MVENAFNKWASKVHPCQEDEGMATRGFLIIVLKMSYSKAELKEAIRRRFIVFILQLSFPCCYLVILRVEGDTPLLSRPLQVNVSFFLIL